MTYENCNCKHVQDLVFKSSGHVLRMLFSARASQPNSDLAILMTFDHNITKPSYRVSVPFHAEEQLFVLNTTVATSSSTHVLR